jgi:glutathione transport system permease protein
MIGFLVGRTAKMLMTLVVVISAVFFAVRLSGDPIDYLAPDGMDAESRRAMIVYWGLDRPILDQFVAYWHGVAANDFGLGLVERRPVQDIFGDRVWASLSLLLAVLGLTVSLGIPLGVAAALWRQRAIGSLVQLAAFVGYAVPNFVLSILLLLVFSASLHWLPSTGSGSLAHYVLPTVALSAFYVASLTRYTRSSMLDVLGQDYLRTARAKGLSEFVVIVKHALRNALIPVVTVLGLQVTTLVAGAIVVETVFAWHGIGDLMIQATIKRDYPVLQFGVLAIAVAVVVVNFLVDLTYAAIDPRIRLADAGGGRS